MRTIEQMISSEVLCCMSSLVSTLAGGYGINTGDGHGSGKLWGLEAMLEQAGNLASPIEDWEEAAREAGWQPAEGGGFENTDTHETEGDTDDWQTLCEAWNIDPQATEVYEHWAVTDWFADKLEAAGEKVDKDFAGLAIWARTTTGQAIYADAVIERIYAETHKAEA